MSTRDRILQYINSKGISKYQFYKETGISNGFLDKTGAVGSDKCEIICSHYPDLSASWLITGEGNMIKTNIYNQKEPAIVVHETKSSYQSPSGIPLIPINAMAEFGNVDLSVLEYQCERFVIPTFKDADFLIEVRGDSMHSKYSSGDIVACKKVPLDTFFQWNKVYVLDTEQGALIKRVKPGTDNEHILIVSDNKEYTPFEICINKIRSLAIVLGVIRLES